MINTGTLPGVVIVSSGIMVQCHDWSQCTQWSQCTRYFGTMPGGHNVLNKFGTLLGIGSVTLYFIILTLIMLNPDKMSSVVTI